MARSGGITRAHGRLLIDEHSRTAFDHSGFVLWWHNKAATIGNMSRCIGSHAAQDGCGLAFDVHVGTQVVIEGAVMGMRQQDRRAGPGG